MFLISWIIWFQLENVRGGRINLDIIVEIGTEEQKELIRKELSVIKIISRDFNPHPQITQIIVPEDFERKANDILGIEHYKSKRGDQVVIAKNVPTEDGIILLFSKELYTDSHDNQTRLQIYLHEFIHAFNKLRFPKISEDPKAANIYFGIIYTLFDEYDANRKSFKITEKVYPQLSHRYKSIHALNLKEFVKTICDDSLHLKKLRKEIVKFRSHNNVDLFLECTKDLVDEVSKSIIYVYSYLDQNYKLTKNKALLEKSYFINDKAIALIDFFRVKYEKEDNNLFDGRKIIEDFMTNFGFRFEDTPKGIYFHILNI